MLMRLKLLISLAEASLKVCNIFKISEVNAIRRSLFLFFTFYNPLQ